MKNNISSPAKLFTKSAFKLALECPQKLYYARQSQYENQNNDDEFLASLAEGGFQVGALAKIYCDVPTDNDIKEKDYEGSLARTAELMQQQNVNIAEAAFKFANLFVRVDVLKRRGNHIDLIEVKAKSWNPEEDKFMAKDSRKKDAPINTVVSKNRPYVYDVAFQKYVVVNALRELYPNEVFTVTAYLMMADKSKCADIDGINQMFKICKVDGETAIEVVPDAEERLKASKTEVLTAFDVDDICDKIIAGTTTEQGNEGWMQNMKFQDFVPVMADHYCHLEKYPICEPSAKCFGCQFCASKDSDKKDGFKECWHDTLGFTSSQFDLPMVKELWGGGGKPHKNDFLQQGMYFLQDITEDILPLHKEKKPNTPGLDANERKWLQIGMTLGKDGILQNYASDIHDNAYLDIDGLREEMAQWKFPLHMIDFETTAVALPFYKGMKSFEQVAFQFSHHIIRRAEDGSYTVEHHGQYLNEDVNAFPNFEFLRALRDELSNDDGTVFRYAAHENTILRCIYKQLEDSQEPDREELMAFIDTLTHYKDGKTLIAGERDMVDLLEVVKRYFYEPKEMKGSNSIKVVLPAVLNTSQMLKDKYSKSIYGSVIPSKNIAESAPIAWIKQDEAGHVENPYHLLPSVAELLQLDESATAYMESQADEGEDMTVANGGAALTAYNKLMFSDQSMTVGLREALLRYCELDTMAMVFIWEYFNDECSK